jgi:ligand-binding sensor domain-containing protein/signal transduction histidine kinase/DNA-binding response OmpR family regulator
MQLQKKSLFLIFILLICCFSSVSRDFRFRKIDMSTGLSYNSVLCVIQDHEGLLWVGTREGLNKYNSVDIDIYKNQFNDSLSLSNNQINCIYETFNQDIWVGTARGLNRYDRIKNIFRQYLVGTDSTGLSNGYVKCIVQNTDSCIWVGTSNGLNILDPKCKYFKKLVLEDPPSFSNNVIALFRDRQNRIWIGTKGGLFMWEKNNFNKIELHSGLIKFENPFEIRDIKEDLNGRIWVATEEYGIYSFEYSNGKIFNLTHRYSGNSEIISDHIRKIFIDKDILWLATLDGVCLIEKNTGKITNIAYSPSNPEGIGNSSIHDVIKDNSGGFWLATYTNGLNYYHPQNCLFPHFKRIPGMENSLSSNAITGFLEDVSGNMWISTGAAGVNYLNLHNNRFGKFLTAGKSGLSNDNVKSMSADQKGNLWIGTYKGLNLYNLTANSFTHFLHDPDNRNSLNQNQVHVVYVDQEGLVWIGMNDGIFQVYDPGKKLFKEFPEIGTIVNTIFEDRNGKIWIGERFGLHCLDRKTQIPVDVSDLTLKFKTQLYDINCIGEDSKGRIWIGTQSSGIILLKSDTGFQLSVENGLSDNTVNAILEDNSGFFWISTNKGISKITYTENEKGIPQLKSTDFTMINGLQGPQFEKHSAFKSSSGKLFFGGINGFNAFSPGDVEKYDFFPTVVLSELQVNFKNINTFIRNSPLNIPINEQNKLILKYNQRNIFLRFAGINFINPGGTYYRYMLSGTDKNWIDIGDRRTINFTFLPVGEHELRIKASTNQNIWGDDFRKLTIVVLPPWWQTWYAYSFYLVFVVFLLFVFFRYSQRWAILKNKLQMEHFEREKELELHESKLKFFTDVSHELRTPLTLILAPLEKIILHPGTNEPLNKQLTLIQRNGNRMMQLIDQVLNLGKLETGHERLQAAEANIVDFLKEICLAFHEVALSRNINFEFRYSIEKFNVWFDRDKMEIIIYNLLSNALKNTPPGGCIEVVLTISNSGSIEGITPGNENLHYIQISVIDNGKGISEGEMKHIFDRFYTVNKSEGNSKGFGIGLELTKRMVELHKGFIKVESQTASPLKSGITKFSVYLPVGKDHLTPEEINHDFNNSDDSNRYTHELQFHEKMTNLLPFDDTIELPKLSDKDKQTLLIVEDNPEVRAFIRDLFSENYLVEEAENGLKGWNIAVQVIPDLVISDIMMPEMDGIELCRKLKTDIRTSHIPVILLSARTTLTFKYEGLETGADDYITKPFSAQLLIIRVRNLIKQRNILRSYFHKEAILEPENVTVTSVDERLLKKAVGYITQNIENSSISVEQLSQELGLSRVHLYRKIKALTNLTAVDFIRSIRLKKAAVLLQQGKLTIKEVQNMVGFENPNYFRNCFKEQFGMSPSAYASQFVSRTEESMI